jgi:cysteine synthase A
MLFQNITQTIGNTPLVVLGRLAQQANVGATLMAKLEFFNPIGGVKDRIGVALLDALEAEGKAQPGQTTLIEATSGNTGLALASVAAVRGYRLIIVMPDSASIERRKMLALLGAEVVLTKGAQGMRGTLQKAQQLLQTIPHSVMPQQFEQQANPLAHYTTTAAELWRDTDGQIDVFIAGVGTGGTLSGVGRFLREKNSGTYIVAVEPEDSAVLSGGAAGVHKIQGIGAGFVPTTLDTTLIDEVLTVNNQSAFATARLLARAEGIPVGISSGAAAAAALELAQRPQFANARIVFMVPSFAERYLSSPLFEGLG